MLPVIYQHVSKRCYMMLIIILLFSRQMAHNILPVRIEDARPSHLELIRGFARAYLENTIVSARIPNEHKKILLATPPFLFWAFFTWVFHQKKGKHKTEQLK